LKLSISNIAWPFDEQEKYFSIVKELGASGIEIAPGIIWNSPTESTSKERRGFRSLVEEFELEICSIQALLFGQSHLGLFKGELTEHKTAEYLKRICDLASDVGAKVLVFGSPGARARGNLTFEEAFDRASRFFKTVAKAAHDAGVFMCIEPLRPQETDFIMSAEDGLKLVKMVDHPGFALHLDAKAVSAEGKNFKELFQNAGSTLKHFHVNDPELIEVNDTQTLRHEAMGAALREVQYPHFISIEMRKQSDYLNSVKRSLNYTRKAYLNESERSTTFDLTASAS